MNHSFVSVLVSTLAFGVTSVAAFAQELHVVPDGLAHAEGNAMFAPPGISTRARVQVLIAATELQPLIGRELTGVMLRRASKESDALDSGSGRLALRIGHAARSPEQAVRNFEANLPVSTEVYRGVVTAPASAAVSAPSWESTDTIRVDFNAGFTYLGGTLAVEFEALEHAGLWWPVDAVSDPVAGTAQSFGSACGPLSTWGLTAGVQAAGLVTGRTATFHLLGRPSAPAALLIGFGLRTTPVDLGMFGAPGCTLEVDPVLDIATMLSPREDGMAGQGLTNVDLHIPADPNWFGASIGAQFVELHPTTFVTSNALACQIASSPPYLPMTAVASRAGELPDVVSVGVPVLGLVWH